MSRDSGKGEGGVGPMSCRGLPAPKTKKMQKANNLFKCFYEFRYGFPSVWHGFRGGGLVWAGSAMRGGGRLRHDISGGMEGVWVQCRMTRGSAQLKRQPPASSCARKAAAKNSFASLRGSWISESSSKLFQKFFASASSAELPNKSPRESLSESEPSTGIFNAISSCRSADILDESDARVESGGDFGIGVLASWGSASSDILDDADGGQTPAKL